MYKGRHLEQDRRPGEGKASWLTVTDDEAATEGRRSPEAFDRTGTLPKAVLSGLVARPATERPESPTGSG